MKFNDALKALEKETHKALKERDKKGHKKGHDDEEFALSISSERLQASAFLNSQRTKRAIKTLSKKADKHHEEAKGERAALREGQEELNKRMEELGEAAEARDEK